MKKNNSAIQIIQAIKDSKKPIICMDSRADFDAICSCTILHNYITKMLNKEVYITFDGELPSNIRDLVSDYADLSFLHENVCPANIDFSQYDLQIFLDSGNIEHICKDRTYDSNTKIKKLNIDHHESNPLYGDFNYIKPYASCCTVLFYLFKEAKISSDKELDNIFYLGVLLDSGFFQFINTTPEDLVMVAELIKGGMDFYKIVWKLSFNINIHTFKVKALVLSNLVVKPELKVAYSTITLDELATKGILYEESVEPPADMIKRLQGMDFVFVVREQPDAKNTYSLSLRSHHIDCNVQKIATYFGGGGHKMAAGAVINAGSIDEVVNKVLDYVSQNSL